MARYVLLVDSNSVHLDTDEHLSKAQGLESVRARDGEEALKEIKKRGAPTLLMTELTLPRLDGFALLEALVKAGKPPPALALSNFVELRNAAFARRAELVAVIDVDGFKQVNDLRGHAAGDTVLQGVFAALMREARRSDLLVRWGGDELLAVLPGADSPMAMAVAERLRAAVEQATFGDLPRVTLSVGIAQLQPAEDPQTLLERADERLYQAKSSGKNRVC